MFKKAVRDHLVGDAAITVELEAFDFSTGMPEPGIFTSRMIPETTGRPVIWIQDTGSDRDFGTRGHRGGDQFLDILVLGNRIRTDKGLEALAILVWKRMHRANLRGILEGFCPAMCVASPPVEVSDADGFYAWSISLQIRFDEP